MYYYIQSESTPEFSLWTVGYNSPDGTWHPESDHSVREEAADRVAELNGSPQKRLSELEKRIENLENKLVELIINI